MVVDSIHGLAEEFEHVHGWHMVRFSMAEVYSHLAHERITACKKWCEANVDDDKWILINYVFLFEDAKVATLFALTWK